MHIPKWLIATAGFLLMTLIASVAFLIGRDSSQAPIAAPAPTHDLPSVRDTAPEPTAAGAGASGVTMTSPITASTSAAVSEAPPSTASSLLSSISAPPTAVDSSPETSGARARVSAYFTQMDALQPGELTGGPEAFARTVLQGAGSGDFTGLDDLVRAAGDAERRAVALQPPGECADYHRMAVTLLQESRTMITALRDGIKRNDTNALTALGATAQSMKSRADALAAAERGLRVRFGL